MCIISFTLLVPNACSRRFIFCPFFCYYPWTFLSASTFMARPLWEKGWRDGIVRPGPPPILVTNHSVVAITPYMSISPHHCIHGSNWCSPDGQIWPWGLRSWASKRENQSKSCWEHHYLSAWSCLLLSPACCSSECSFFCQTHRYTYRGSISRMGSLFCWITISDGRACGFLCLTTNQMVWENKWKLVCVCVYVGGGEGNYIFFLNLNNKASLQTSPYLLQKNQSCFYRGS